MSPDSVPSGDFRGSKNVQVGNHNIQHNYRFSNQASPKDADGVPAGRYLAGVTDPIALEVHQPVHAEDPLAALPLLPTYVAREHDQRLAQVVRTASGGVSRIAVMVGGSSTGKTRACWEALNLLRKQPQEWRLWHPIYPARPEAALLGLPSAGRRTVVWLNEAQFYLDAAGGLGEWVAAGLRELLRDPERAPVLVLATMWPQFWNALTARPADGDDRHAQARELLAGHNITVPASFTDAQLEQLRETEDARLTLAAARAQDGQVIQFLAGVPELMSRYENAPPTAKALIHAAMDARRMGAGIALPLSFLEKTVAQSGYLTADEWDCEAEDWLEQALADTEGFAKGIRGPLTRIRRPARSGAAESGTRNSGKQVAGSPDGPLYRLADYLDQHGRTERKGHIPPAGFWAAAADHACPADQAALGDAAHARGLYRDAAQLRKNAAARVSLDGPRNKGWLLNSLQQAELPELVTALADHAAAYFPLDDPFSVALLLDHLRDAGADEQVTALLHRDPAACVCLDAPGDVASLLRELRQADAHEQATALAARAATDTALDDPAGVALLLRELREAGEHEQVTVLLHRDPAACVRLNDLRGIALLLQRMQEAGAHEQATAVAARAAAHVPLGNPVDIAWLLKAMPQAGASEPVTALAARAAARVPLANPLRVATLLQALRETGTHEQVTALLRRDPAAHVSLDKPGNAVGLLRELREAGALGQLTALAGRIRLDDPGNVAGWLRAMREAGAHEQVTALLHRDPAAHVRLDDPAGVAWLLRALREAGAHEQATALLHRDPAACVRLNDLRGIAMLLQAMREADALEQVTALAARAATDTNLDSPDGVVWLLYGLRETGEHEQVTVLLRRNPAACVRLNDLRGIAMLLPALQEADAHEQVTVLLRRNPAACVSLDEPGDVAWLLRVLRHADTQEQINILVERLPGEGMFRLFREQEDHEDRFRFGREVDGSPAKPWGWRDLD